MGSRPIVNPAADMITAARKRQQLSYEAAAAASGMSASALRKLEAGKTAPQERTLRKIAAGLGINLNALLEAGGFEPVDETEAYNELGAEALARDAHLLGKLDQFVTRYEELGHTYRRLDERVEGLEAFMVKRGRALDRRLSSLEKRVDEMSQILAELTELVRNRRSR